MAGGRMVERVLLVDDSETVLHAWSLSCHRADKQSFCASTRRRALESARRKRPDLIVVDLFLRDESGLDVVRDLRAAGVDGFIALVSAHICVDYAMLAVHAGANDCFDKTVPLSQIIRRVETGRRWEPDRREVPSLQDVEWQHIARVLNDCDGNISHAAEVLGEHRQSLQRKIQRHAPGALRLRGRRARRRSQPRD